MPVKFVNPRAFAAMTQPVVWRQDKAPHRCATFSAAVLQGESQSNSAGPTSESILADPWSVIVPLTTGLAASITVGDTITTVYGAELTVHQATISPNGYVLRCTANERPST